MDTMHESKVERATLVSGKENLNTYLQLVEDATKAMFGWQHEMLKFADTRVAANVKLVSDVTEAKDAGEFARILVEHVSNMYEHISNTVVRYSQGVQDILREGSKDNPKSAPTTVHEYAKQSTGEAKHRQQATERRRVGVKGSTPRAGQAPVRGGRAGSRTTVDPRPAAPCGAEPLRR